MDIVEQLLPIIKELLMEYGLWETTLALTISAVFIVIAWRLPNILSVLKDWRK